MYQVTTAKQIIKYFSTSTVNYILSKIRIENSKLISIFKSKLIFFICSIQSDINKIFNTKGLKFLTCLRLSLSLLNKHKFRHFNFQDFMNPLCSCSLEIEDTSYYLLHSHYFYHQWIDFRSSEKPICNPTLSPCLILTKKYKILQYAAILVFDENKNRFVLEATINYIKNSERFSETIFE